MFCKKGCISKFTGKHLLSYLLSVGFLEPSLILFLALDTQSVSKPTSRLSWYCLVVTHNLCIQSCHVLPSPRDWLNWCCKVVRKGQIHSHIEKLGSGRVGFLVEKLYHLEALVFVIFNWTQKGTYCIELNKEAVWLILEAVSVGRSFQPLMSGRRKLEWTVSAQYLNPNMDQRKDFQSHWGIIQFLWGEVLGPWHICSHTNDKCSYRTSFLSPRVSLAPHTFIFHHKVLTLYVKAFVWFDSPCFILFCI